MFSQVAVWRSKCSGMKALFHSSVGAKTIAQINLFIGEEICLRKSHHILSPQNSACTSIFSITIIIRKITINNLKCYNQPVFLTKHFNPQCTHHHYYNNPSHLHIGSGDRTFVSRGNIINLLKPKDPKAFPYHHIRIDPAAASDPPHCTGLNKLTIEEK